MACSGDATCSNDILKGRMLGPYGEQTERLPTEKETDPRHPYSTGTLEA